MITVLVAIYGANAQNMKGLQSATLPPAIPPPEDTPFAGIIPLSVDLTDLAHRIVEVHETVPVHGSDVTLLYPEWIPGTHSPSGPIASMTGLTVTANGKRLDWLRDRVNVYAFHISVPHNATNLEINFQYLSPLAAQQTRFSPKIVDLSWNNVLLYPAGYFSRQIQFAPVIRFPEGWKFATALELESQHGSPCTGRRYYRGRLSGRVQRHPAGLDKKRPSIWNSF